MKVAIVNDKELDEKSEQTLADMMSIDVDTFRESFTLFPLFSLEELDEREVAPGRAELRDRLDRELDALTEFDKVILLGKPVASVFGMPTYVRSLTWRTIKRGGKSQEYSAAFVPDPVGRNTWYNTPRNRRNAENFLRKLAAAAEPAEDSASEPDPEPEEAEDDLEA